MTKSNKTTVSKLINDLSHVDYLAAKQAEFDLKNMPPKETLGLLSYTLLNNNCEGVRAAVARIIGSYKTRDAIPVLIEALRCDDSMPVRLNAASALGEIKAIEAVPVLIKALADRSEFVRDVASHSLVEIGTREAISALVKYLQTTDDECLADEVREALKKLDNSE